MTLKKRLKNIYIGYLRKKYHMTKPGSELLAAAFWKDYREHSLPYPEIHRIHKKGFKVSLWKEIGHFYDEGKLLSNAEYCSKHPYNGAYSKWIDDKLILKYLCSGTELDQYMPRYFFQTDKSGEIYALMDYEKSGHVTPDAVARLLEREGKLALKRIAGYFGTGFNKAVYLEGLDKPYAVGDTAMDREEFCDYISKLKNYIITEFLETHEDLAEFYDGSVNCLRYTVGRFAGGDFEKLKTFIRIGTEKSGLVENFHAGGVACIVDENGYYDGGFILDVETGKDIEINEHPDNGRMLKGRIPLWDEVQTAVKRFSDHFPQLKYIGFDFALTSDNRVIVIEINSLPGIPTMQMDTMGLDDSCEEFFRKECGIKKLNAR